MYTAFMVKQKTSYTWLKVILMGIIAGIANISLVMCIAVSVMGGLISAAITTLTGVVDKSGPKRQAVYRLLIYRGMFQRRFASCTGRFPPPASVPIVREFSLRQTVKKKKE